MTQSISVQPLYHVPRSQVWEGSRGGHRGCVHLHVDSTVELVAVTGRAGRIVRRAGAPLCGKPRGWYERAPEREGPGDLCPRCEITAARYGVEIPDGFRS